MPSGELVLADHALVAVEFTLHAVSAMGNAGGFGQQANNLIASPAIGSSDLDPTPR
jgi:hypothetical protein